MIRRSELDFDGIYNERRNDDGTLTTLFPAAMTSSLLYLQKERQSTRPSSRHATCVWQRDLSRDAASSCLMGNQMLSIND